MEKLTRGFMIMRSTARIPGLVLLVFWGAFFLEHLGWFLGPHNQVPPLRVWLLQAVHLLMLLGFVVAWKRELLGSGLITGRSLVFLHETAGTNFHLFFPLTIVPALLFLACWLKGKSGQPETGNAQDRPTREGPA